MPNLPRQPKPRNRQAIRRACADEFGAARHARTAGDRAGEWAHLERAHILSQPVPASHVRTHLAMLGFGIRRRDRREVAGQVVRLLVAWPGSALRRYPLGNTGGADVNALVPQPIPADLRAVLDAAFAARS
jgi:hypothetical protein